MLLVATLVLLLLGSLLATGAAPSSVDPRSRGLQWNTTLPHATGSAQQPGTTLALSARDDQHYYIADHLANVYALRLTDGSIAWQFAAQTLVTLNLIQEMILLDTGDGVAAVNTDNGQQVWFVSTWSFGSTPIVSHSPNGTRMIVFVNIYNDAQTLVAANLATAAVFYSLSSVSVGPFVAPTSSSSSSSVTAPLAVCLTGAPSLATIGLNLTTGDVVWAASGVYGDWVGATHTGLALIRNVNAPDVPYPIAVVGMMTGVTLHNVSNFSRILSVSGAMIHHDVVCAALRTPSYLTTWAMWLGCFNAGDGAILWLRNITEMYRGNDRTGEPCLAGGHIVFSYTPDESVSGVVEGYNMITGKRSWATKNIPSRINSGHYACLQDGTVLVLSEAGGFTGVRGADGVETYSLASGAPGAHLISAQPYFQGVIIASGRFVSFVK